MLSLQSFIGLQEAGIIVGSEATLVTLGNVKSPTVLLAFLGIVVISILYYKNIYR